MEQFIFNLKTGKIVKVFNYELDLSGTYDYVEFDDKFSDDMDDDLELFDELKTFFEPLLDDEYLKIITKKDALENVEKAKVELGIINNYKKHLRKRS